LAMADPSVAEAFTRLVDLMARLHAPGGCPWDREQTPASLRPSPLEEVDEVLEAIDADDPAHLRDELGDLLLQIVFQSELAAEAGRFTVADVAHAIVDKLVRRHPHVFGDVRVRDAGEVVRNWRRIKAEERRTAGEDGDLFAGVRAAPRGGGADARPGARRPRSRGTRPAVGGGQARLTRPGARGSSRAPLGGSDHRGEPPLGAQAPSAEREAPGAQPGGEDPAPPPRARGAHGGRLARPCRRRPDAGARFT